MDRCSIECVRDGGCHGAGGGNGTDESFGGHIWVTEGHHKQFSVDSSQILLGSPQAQAQEDAKGHSRFAFDDADVVGTKDRSITEAAVSGDRDKIVTVTTEARHIMNGFSRVLWVSMVFVGVGMTEARAAETPASSTHHAASSSGAMQPTTAEGSIASLDLVGANPSVTIAEANGKSVKFWLDPHTTVRKDDLIGTASQLKVGQWISATTEDGKLTTIKSIRIKSAPAAAAPASTSTASTSSSTSSTTAPSKSY